MASSRVETQITWSSANSVSVAAGATSTSDAFTFNVEDWDAALQLSADNDGTPASGDTVTFSVAFTAGDILGDSSTAAAAGQTDLQAASNKTWKAMDATYPTAGTSQQAVFRSTFATGDANYAWNEFAVRRSTGTLLLNRGVSSMGTKTSAGTWVATVTMSLS